MKKTGFFVLGLSLAVLIGAAYKIQSDNLLIGRNTPGEKSLEFQAGLNPNPRIYVDRATADSLRFSEQNFIFGQSNTVLPDDGYSILFEIQNTPQHALPGFNFNGTRLQVRETIGDVWTPLASGYGLTADQNKFLDDTLRVDSRTDVPISDFGSTGYFLWREGSRSTSLSDYQTGTVVTHGNTANPVRYNILIKDNFTILRFEDSQDSSVVAVTLDTQNPIAGYKRYIVDFPSRADVGTYAAIVSEGQAEKYSFNSDFVINRNNLAEDVQNSLSGGTVPAEPSGTEAHRRFVSDLSFNTVEADAWGIVFNHPNFRPYHFHRLAASFWAEDNTGTSITNFFDDVTGVVFTLNGGAANAHFGSSTTWTGYTSYFTDTLTLTNATTGSHGGAEIGTGSFRDWYSTISMLPSVGLTRIANAGPSNVLTNFNTDKRFALSLSGNNVISFLEYNSANTRFALTTLSDVGNLTLYRNGTAVGAAITPTSSTRAINSTTTGNFQYLWTTEFDDSDIIAFSSSSSGFKMLLVNDENTVRFGNFTRLAGGPFDNTFHRAVAFDYRLAETTGIENLLTIGNDPTTITFGGTSTVPRQTVIGSDEVGTFILIGAEDGGVTTAKELTYLHKTAQTIPHQICTIEATGSEADSPITNNCNFNLNTPSSGQATLKIFVHFVNSALPSDEQALPVSIVPRTVTIGTNSAASGTSITIPWQKNTANSFDTQTFTLLSSYNGTNNQVDITTSAGLDNFLRANDSTVSLNISLASEQDTNHALNNDLSLLRIWPSQSTGQTQSIIFWIHREENQSPDETDPYLTISGVINGTNFSRNLNRRASEFDFSNMRLGNANIEMAHVQVYSYEFEQNQLTNIYGPNTGDSFGSNLYQHRNAWLGLWSHPDEDVGEFVVNDDLVAPNLLESSSFSGRTRVEVCGLNSNGTVKGVEGSCSWILNSTHVTLGHINIAFRSGIFSSIESCFANGRSSLAHASADNVAPSGLDVFIRSTSNNAFVNTPFSILCMGAR